MRKKGFTLTELLVVMAILAIAVSIGVPVISSISGKAGLEADRITAQSIETSIDFWISTDYADDSFQRNNLFTSASTGEATQGRIGGHTEQMYSYYFAGTEQLPGTELQNEAEIRHSVITAIKATADTKLDIRSGEQFIKPPQSGTKYGFKYYYKIGRVTVERIDSTESTLGDDEVYKYYVWLDQEGSNISANVEPKRAKGNPYLSVTDETLCAFRFDFGSRDISKIRVEIETGGQAYTMFSNSQTPAMFKPGFYDIRVYYDGSLVKSIVGYSLAGGSENIVA